MAVVSGPEEAARLAALDSYGILDTAAEQGFDDLTHLAARSCEAPTALVSLVARDRQWFKSKIGFDPPETDLRSSVCRHALGESDLLVIPDLTRDERTSANPLVTGPTAIRFYAGAPLRTPGGLVLGSLCVIDTTPRPAGLTPDQADTLRRLGRQVVSLMELRRSLADRREEDARHRQILQSAVDFAIVATDRDGRVTEWNTGAERILGWSADEMRGQTAERFFTPEDRAAGLVEAEMRRALADGQAADERMHCRRDGSVFFASGEMMPLRTESGAHIGFVKILRDRSDEHRAGEALREAEANVRRAQEAGGVGLFWVGMEDGVLHATPQMCRLYGLPAQASYPARVLEDLVIPEDQAVISTVESRRQGDIAPDTEYRIRRADTGALRTISRQGEIGRDPDGRAVRFSGAVRDITDEVEIRDALRAEREQLAGSEEQFRVFAQAVPNQIWAAGPEGDLDWFNEQVYAYSGAGRGTLDGPTEWTRIIHPEDLPDAAAAWTRSLETGAVYETEFRIHRADGVYRWFLIRAEPVRGPDGTIIRWVGTNTDIDDRRRQAVELARLNDTLEQQVEDRTRERNRIWETTNDLMGTAGLDGFLKAVNPAWTPALGWSEHELLSRPFAEIIDPADLAQTADVVARLATGQTVTGFVDRVLTKGGEARTMMWTAVPDPGTSVFHIVGRDLTEQRKVEEALRQSQKMEAVGQLTGGIAHDFNNLLTGISGSLELLQTRMSQGRFAEVDRYVNAAQGASKRAAALTHRLLAFSRRQTLDPKPTDVNRLVIDMEDLIRRTIGPDIALEVVTAGGLWSTLVDPPQLENALLNLCINARDAMPEGGRITVETANKWLDDHAARERDLPPGQYLSLCVTDTGTGMTPDVIGKAFDPFFTTKPIGQGTGLGLSMIYGFVRQSGGQVRIYSEIGQGTTMCLYLPRHRGSEAPAGELADAEMAPRAAVGETVLVVDDEPTVRMLVIEVLEDLGYRAIEASDGSSGLRVLHSNERVDLLITDVGLPGGMNGRQMADAARVQRPDLKVLFITGYAENAVVGNGHLEPGMQVMTKPFVMDALAVRIRDMIGT